jgi:hypothetical protein
MEEGRLQAMRSSSEKGGEEVMPDPTSLTVKTHGWLVQTVTAQNIIDTSTWTTFTTNLRFAWGLQQKIELQGIAMQGKVLYPQGFAIQETHPPEGFNHRKSIFKILEQGQPAAWTFGMPWGIEIHDLWMTVPFTEENFQKFAGFFANEQLGPAFLRPAMGSSTGYIPYKDFEQIVAARSRIFMGDNLGLSSAEIADIDASVREQPARRVHDVTWGSGEPIASQDLYHVRICITRCGVDATGASPEEYTFKDLASDQPWYCWVPPSIQPMLAISDKPSFLARMTMERRSKAV